MRLGNLLFALFLILATSSCSRKVYDATYRVALRHIPETGDPYTSQVDTDHFIMLQLYYPLFQHQPDGTLGSKFLDMTRTHADDASFLKFSLCLQKNIRFSDGSPIQIADLLGAIKKAHGLEELLPDAQSISEASGCVHVTLKTADPKYFAQLTGIASTVTRQKTKGGFPIGFGPYQVEHHSPDRLLLQANPGQVTGSFRWIEFRKFTNVRADYGLGVSDFNHTGQVTVPPDIKDNFQRVSRPFYKSYAIVLNYPDARLRKRFAACFPTSRFRSLIELPLHSTQGFLPSGIQGSESVKALRTSRLERCKTEAVTPVTLLNYRPELRRPLLKFLSSYSNRFPIPIRYKEGTVDQLVKAVFHQDRLMAVIGFDSSTSDASAFSEAATFFESFIREARADRVISQPVEGLGSLVRSAAQANDPAVKEADYHRANQILVNSGYVIPLGQLNTDQFYARSIRNIAWSDRISGFPDISRMEIVR